MGVALWRLCRGVGKTTDQIKEVLQLCLSKWLISFQVAERCTKLKVNQLLSFKVIHC